MGDPFGAPAPRAVRGKGKGSEYIDPGGIRRDRWDRPLLPHPHTGEVRPWTSVTTLAGTLADRYALGQWQLRAAVKGMGIRHDLAALAAGTPFDDSGKATLQSIANDAMEAAGASAGRNTGSALHALTDEFDHASTGDKVAIVRRSRPDLAADLKAYAQTLAEYEMIVRPDLIERMTVCLATESAGTADRFLMCPDGRLRIADLKTGQHAGEYGFYELAQQLAQYANGEALWRVTNSATGEGVWEAFPTDLIDRTLGILIHLPAGQARCELQWVDLGQGFAEAITAMGVRERRKSSKAWVMPIAPPAPASNGAQVAAALNPMERLAEVVAMPSSPLRDSLLSTADDAGVLDESSSPRQQFVDSGHAGCIECLAPNEDPAPWCDCRPDEECPPDRSCRRRAHRVNECVEAGGRDHWLAGRDQARARSVLAEATAPGAQAVTDASVDHMLTEAAEAAERGTPGAREALDALLVRRIEGAPDTDALMALAQQHASVWTADMQAAAARRWEALTA